MEAATGEACYIRIFVGLRAAHGHASGGAQISISTTRALIFLTPLAPTVAGEPVRWLVPAAGAEFTEHLVADLLLSVFANDPAATQSVGRYMTP
jgi:hypothetical protein